MEFGMAEISRFESGARLCRRSLPGMPAVAAFLLLCAMQASAQEAGRSKTGNAGGRIEHHNAWRRIKGDSVLVRYALPRAQGKRPAVIVLPDRFGMRPHVDNILTVFAELGFRAYAVSLRSTPEQGAAGAPAFSIDSADIDAVAQVAVDIRNEEDCNGKAGLLAFDAGAAIGASAASRFPIFQSCVLVSPSPADVLLDAVVRIESPVNVIIGQYDPEGILRGAEELKDQLPERRTRIRVSVIRGAGMFFYNREHEGFDRKSYNAALVAAAEMFRATL